MLTTKGAATRRRIIEGAAREIREQGAAGVRIEDIMRRTATSKSQIFHYFPQGREELLLAVAAHEADQVLADQQPHLSQLTTWAGWQAWRDAVVDRYRRQGEHCPLGALTTEIGRGTPATQAITGQLIRRWQDYLRVGIAAMQQSGEIRSTLDPDRTAAAIIAGIQGGVVILMATGRNDHLTATLDSMLLLMRGSGH
jgi:AcrR family transcriptional regulator